MDVGNLCRLMQKTQSSVLEHGFLVKRLEELRHVSVILLLVAKFVSYISAHEKAGRPFLGPGLRRLLPHDMWT